MDSLEFTPLEPRYTGNDLCPLWIEFTAPELSPATYAEAVADLRAEVVAVAEEANKALADLAQRATEDAREHVAEELAELRRQNDHLESILARHRADEARAAAKRAQTRQRRLKLAA